MALSLALNTMTATAQGIWDKQMPPNPDRLKAFSDYFAKKLPSDRKTCEVNNKKFTENVATEMLSAARNAGRKSEQEELNKRGVDLMREAAVHARVTCLTQFYWTLRGAYNLSNVASWRYNAVELMLTDDLTEPAMRGVGSRVLLRSDQWQQEVLFQPMQDFSKVFQPARKLGATSDTGGDLLRMVLKNDFREIYKMFFDDMRRVNNGFRSFGCDWIDGDPAPIRCD